jgi:hypothetical protein
LTARYAVSPPPRFPRKPKNRIPEEPRPAYAEVLAAAVDLRAQGMTHLGICKALNRLGYRTRIGKRWRHPQQIVKLLRSFDNSP